MTGISSTVQQSGLRGWQHAWENFWGVLSYRYFLWRKDTSSDLLLFAGFNLGLLLIGSFLKVFLWIVRKRSSAGPETTDVFGPACQLSEGVLIHINYSIVLLVNLSMQISALWPMKPHLRLKRPG